ncbi:glycosyltransferase [Clostridium sediminicola]|uniref:glycosyltransferase n=1 Tax=Clostridium sediminicola TaxID=3114879 RepID=UPI0031F23DFD
MTNKKVMIIPSRYPSEDMPLKGIFFKEQAKYLGEHGINVVVIYPEIRSILDFSLKKISKFHFQKEISYNDQITTYRKCNWNIIPLRFELGCKIWINEAVRLAEDYIKKNGTPTIIHAHCTLWGGYVAKILSDRYKIPYVITEHSTAYARLLIKDWQAKYIIEAFDSAKCIIPVSNPLKELLMKYNSDENKFKVIPNVVDTEFFELKSDKLKSKKFVFLTVAFLSKKKSIDLLIKAFHKAFEGNKEVFLYIGGDGDEKESLELLVNKLKIQDKVKFLGSLTRNEVKEYMENADVFVLPSQVETFGVVFIEALSTGLPVLGTKCGGPEDIINENVGLLINKNNLDELVLALRKLYRDCKKYNPIALRNYVIQKFSKKAIVSQIIKVYKD